MTARTATCANAMSTIERVTRSARGILAAGLLAVWDKVQPAGPHPWVPSISPSDNLQRAMNLVMPLKPRYVLQQGELAKELVKATEMIFVGLDNVGTIHNARFLVIADNLCMMSVYDGELNGYIRDFIGSIGQAFDVLMTFVADPPCTPVAQHPDEFIAWIADHDAYQFPSESTELHREVGSLERESLLLIRRHRHVQFGTYHRYPGYSAAEISQALGIGW